MKNRSLKKTWLFAIIIVTPLLVAVILVLGYQAFKAAEKATFDEFNQRQLVLSQEAISGIELYFELLAGDMKRLSRMPEVQHIDNESLIRRELQLLFDHLGPWGVNEIGVLDADGVLRYSQMAHQLEGVDSSWRSYYQEAKEITLEDTYIIEFIEFKGVEAGQKGILVAVPILRTSAGEAYHDLSDSFGGVALCTLKLGTVTDRLVAPIKSSERGRAFLIDDEYNVLWAPDSSLFGKNLLKEGEGFPGFQHVVERMAAGDSGKAEYSYYKFEDSIGQYSRDRSENLIAYAPIHIGKGLWSIGVWAPKDDVRQVIRSVYIRQLILVGLIILIILLGSSYIIAMYSRTSKFLDKEVEAKTRELDKSHERFLTVLDSLDAAVYVADMETYEILFANKYIQDHFGDVVGKTCWKVLQGGKSGPCDFCSNEKLISADRVPTGLYAWEHFNSVSGLWFDIRDRAIRWVDGRIVRLAIAIEITERKQAEKKLKESEEKFRILSEQSLLGIVILQDGLTVYANEAFSKIIEYSIEEILNWKPGEFERAVHPGENILEMDQAQKKIVNHYQSRIVTKSGIIKYVERYSKTISYDGKKGDMTTFIDITEKKTAEENAKIQQQQLIQADKLASIGVLVAGVAHEINNPNQSSMLHANVIGKAWKSINPILEEYYEENGDFSMGGLRYTEMRKEMPICLNGISYAAKRIDTIVSDLKNFAHKEERHEITTDVNMNLVVKSSIALASNFISKATKNFRVELIKEIPKIKGNFQRLEQVILNLIQNACEALRKREEAVFITTSYNKNKQRVEVKVQDEGEGMPPEDLSQIEDSFFTTKRTTGGTGLGLSISSSIIEDHHGTLDFKSKPGKGTTATIKIPVSKTQNEK